MLRNSFPTVKWQQKVYTLAEFCSEQKICARNIANNERGKQKNKTLKCLLMNKDYSKQETARQHKS